MEGEGNVKLPGLSAAALKWLALVTMLIDHAADVFFDASVRAGAPLFTWKVYIALRCVGRLAFPLYAFLLAEGFHHTRSRARYLLRLGVFALVSELPFDLAFRRAAFNWRYQNVFWTLFLGFAALWLFERVRNRGLRGRILSRAALLAAAALAQLARSDYGGLGVLTVAAMGILRERPRERALVCGALLFAVNPIEAVSYVDFALFRLYNGRRGRQPKYLFYCFYPAHLFILSLLRYWVYGQ